MLDVVAEEMSVLIVIDEILKGTNTRERVAASKAILDYIGSTECLALVATHDNELTATVRFGSKAANAQGSIDLCRKVIAEQAFGQMDVNYYMEYIKEETNGKIFAKIDDFLVDLSTFTKFDYFVGGGFGGGWLFSKPWLNRLAMIIWCTLFLLISVIGIADDFLDGDGVSTTMLAFWGLWIVFFVFSCTIIRVKIYNLLLSY